MGTQTINRVSYYVVLGLSVFAMFLVSGATIFTMLGRFNPSPDGDEGTAAHLFQLAIGLLMPTGLVFLVTADWPAAEGGEASRVAGHRSCVGVHDPVLHGAPAVETHGFTLGETRGDS